MTTARRQQSAYFRALHSADEPLRLSNSWDVASARIAEASGAQAIATTSAGVAWSLGLPDGNYLDRESVVEIVGRISRAVNVPVTADIEGGYSDSAEGVGETVTAIMRAGAVGINLEDGNSDVERVSEKLSAAREAAHRLGGDLFINARTDAFLAPDCSEEQQIDDALRRARHYVNAGADGIFIPGATSESTIAALVAGISAPVNIMVGPGALSVSTLRRLGVARISLGSGVAQSAYAVAQCAATGFLTEGSYASLVGGIGYGTLNGLFVSAPSATLGGERLARA